MASSLRLITPNLVKRSIRPTVIPPSRFLSSYRYYTTLPTDGEVSVRMEMPGLKMEDMRACADQNNTLFIKGKTQFANRNDIMTNIIAKAVADFRNITTKRSWPYTDLFSDRSILGRELCPLMETLSPINIFSIYKHETAEELTTSIDIYEHEEMKLTKQGLLLPSLWQFCDWKREDVKTFFDYDIFFIEGKRKNAHRIIGIPLPEGFHKKHSMVKREMDEYDYFLALLPCVKKEDIKIK